MNIVDVEDENKEYHNIKNNDNVEYLLSTHLDTDELVEIQDEIEEIDDFHSVSISVINVELEKPDASIFSFMIVLSKSSCMIMLNLLCIFMIETINITYIGTFNDPDMITAIGLGTFFSNFVGINAIIGWPGGIDTLSSNAYGAKRYKLVGIYTCICRSILYLYFFIITCPMIFISERFYLFMGQSERIAKLAHSFNKHFLLGIFFFSNYQILLRYLQSMKIFNLGSMTTIISFIFHPFIAYIFIIKLDYQIEGAAISLCITQFINWMILLFLIKRSHSIKKETYFYFINEMLDIKYWKKYFTFGFSSFCLYQTESFASEILIIIASFLSPLLMSANVCIYNFSVILYAVSNSINLAACNLIANGVGKTNVKLVQNYVLSTFIYVILILCILVPSIYYFDIYIAHFYTKHENISKEIINVIPAFLLVLVFDFLLTSIVGINKGLGRQKDAVKFWLGYQYLFGIPFLIFITFYLKTELKGLWFGQSLNLSIVFLGMLYILYRKSFNDTIKEFKAELVDIENKIVSRRNSVNAPIYNSNNNKKNNSTLIEVEEKLEFLRK